jgi:hypothetical protein
VAFQVCFWGVRTYANPRGMREEAISSAVIEVWLGGSRFRMGGLTNHLW